MKAFKNYILPIIICVLLAAIDQIVKHIVVTNMDLHESIPLVKGVFELCYIRNTGSAWGIMAGKIPILLLMSAVVMIVVIYIYKNIVEYKRYNILRVFLILLVAGAIGNMIDRIRLQYVVDFLYFKLINFPIFNIADIYVTISIFTILFLVIFKYNNDDFDVILGDKVLDNDGNYIERKPLFKNKKNSDESSDTEEKKTLNSEIKTSKKSKDDEIIVTDANNNKK